MMQPPFDLGVLVRESLILLIEVASMAKTAANFCLQPLARQVEF